MRRTIRFAPVRAVAAAIANVIIAGPRLDPVRWVGRIAPRPFMMVNADADERLPRREIDRLFASAREPKEFVSMPGGHVRSNAAVIGELAAIVLARVRAE